MTFYFSVDEDGSYHESGMYSTHQEASDAAQQYLKSRDGRYAHPETLEIREEQTPSEMACEILQRTKDGNDLAPQDLKLLESAVNGFLNEKGEVEFYKLYKHVLHGYKKPWYHDIEYMTRDHEGYIYWKGVQVEHYSFSSYEDADFAAKELEQRCLLLEKYHIKPTAGTAIWRYREFEQAEKDGNINFDLLLFNWKCSEIKRYYIKKPIRIAARKIKEALTV